MSLLKTGRDTANLSMLFCAPLLLFHRTTMWLGAMRFSPDGGAVAHAHHSTAIVRVRVFIDFCVRSLVVVVVVVAFCQSAGSTIKRK